MIAVRDVAPDDARELTRWAALERELYGDEPLFAAELDDDLRRWARRETPLSADFDLALFAVSEDGRDVGRCAAFVVDRWQRHHGEAAGFVGHFTIAPDAAPAAVRLLDRAEEWLGRRGVTRVIAGYNGFLTGLGVRVNGFDEEARFPFRWHPRDYATSLMASDYDPVYPWWGFEIDLTDAAARERRERMIAEARCTVRSLDKRRWAEEMALVAEMLNRTFVDEWEFYPLTVDEVRAVYDPVKAVVDPNACLFAEVDGETVGFCLTTPNFTPQVRRARGRMGLLGQLRFALSARRVKDAGLYVIGVDPAQRGRRVGQAMAATALRYHERRGATRASYDIVNDANTGSRALAESLGGVGRILYGQFEKRLD